MGIQTSGGPPPKRFWLLYMQGGDFLISWVFRTVPFKQILCNSIFFKSQNPLPSVIEPLCMKIRVTNEKSTLNFKFFYLVGEWKLSNSDINQKAWFYNLRTSKMKVPEFWNWLFFKINFYRYLSRFFDCLAHPNLSATLATDQKWPLSCRRICYQSLAECHLP